MAYDSTAFVNAAAAAPRNEFRRSDRLVVLMGGAALGALAGLGVALALGRVGAWSLIAVAPVFLVAAYFAIATLRDAIERRAYGCAAAAAAVASSLLAWPACALFFPMSALAFWAAPAAALGSMVLLASCWSGAERAVYRLSGEALSLCAIAAFFGTAQVMG